MNPTVVAAILRHESAAFERRALTPLSNMEPGVISDVAEAAQALVQGDTASIGPAQMQIRFAEELEWRGYVTARASGFERTQALLGRETSVEYVAGAVRYLSHWLEGTPGYSDLSQQQQQRLVLIGYNIGWSALNASMEKRGFAGTIEVFGYDDQTLDEYLRWESEP